MSESNDNEISELGGFRRRTTPSWIMASICLGFFSACTFSLHAMENSSIESYRFAYEKRLEDRFRKNLDSILVGTSYALEVDVILKSSEIIDKLIHPPEQTDSKKEVNDRDQDFTENPLANFSDRAPEADEYVLPLTKLGMWQVKNGPLNKNLTRANDLESGKGERAFNFRDLLATIELRLMLDQSVSAEQERAARKILRDFSDSSVRPRVNVRVSKIAFLKVQKDEKSEKLEREPGSAEKDKSENDKNEPQETLSDKLMLLKLPLAIVFCALIFLLAIFLASRSYQSIETKRLNLLSEQSKREETMLRATYNKEEEAAVVKKAEVQNPEMTDRLHLEVLGKFKEVMVSRPELTSLLVKKWIRFQSDGAADALNFISRNIDVSQIALLLQSLTDEERSLWSLQLLSDDSESGKVKALRFIERELFSNMLAPEENIDPSVKAVLYSVTLAEAIECIRRDVSLGATLITFMQSAQIARIIDHLSPEVVTQLSARGIQLSKAKMLDSVGKLYLLVMQVRKEQQIVSPFVGKIPALMSEMSLDKERSLFIAYASQNGLEEIKSLALQYFPAELIFSLPTDLLRRSLDQMSISSRAELIAASDEVHADKLLELFGGGKTREILEEELTVIREQDNRMRELKRNGKVYLKNFVVQTRALITQSSEYEEQISKILDRWALAIQTEAQGVIRAA
ncbi:MAG: hypothetical protein IPL83_03840 [Bdellovibrionales bacterium]|nr:hypothetical protein [Bdellovibrionales bacterium]